jgi:hypothetical protein
MITTELSTESPPGRRDGHASATSSERWLAAAVFVGEPAALMAYDAKFHEFWRDEAQACLIAVNAPFPEFFSVMHIEGVPFLFHLLLKLFGQVLSPVGALLMGGAVGFMVLLLGTYRLLLAICGDRVRSLAATLILSLTYNYAYELGVVVRQYGLSLGLAMLTIALLRDALRTGQRSYVARAAVVCSLGAMTSAHGAAICGGALVAYGIFALVRRQLSARNVGLLAMTAPFFALTGYLALPFDGRFGATNVAIAHSTEEFLLFGAQAIVGGFTPQDWWVAAGFGAPSTLDRLALARSLAAPLLLLGGVLALLSFGRRVLTLRALEWFDLVAVVTSWGPLAEILVHHYWGSPRHHLFLSVPLTVILVGWILRSLFWQYLVVTWLPYLAYGATLAWMTFALDIRHPFSDVKEAAHLLPNRAHVVADSFTRQVSYLLWRPDITMRGADQRGRYARYTISDANWQTRVPLRALVAEECSAAPDRTYYSGGFPHELGAACVSRVIRATPRTEQYRTDEQVDLYWVDCECLLRGK